MTDTPEIRQLNIVISGRVQGVGFRYLTKRIADQLGIVGSVWNNFDGSVEIEARGNSDAMDNFLAALRESPSPAGTVERLEISPMSEDIHAGDFRIY